MRKILMITPDPDAQGGISTVIKYYQNSEIFKNNKVKIISTYYDQGHIKNTLNYIASLLKLVPSLFDKDIKLVHIHTASKGSFYRKSIIANLCLLFGKIPIMHIHGGKFHEFYANSNNLLKKYISSTLKKCKIIVLSKQWKPELEKMTGTQKNIYVINNPIPIPKISNKKISKTVNIVFLGRLGSRKGTYDLINALKILKSQNYILNFGGDGEVDETLQLIKKNNLNDKTKYLGWIKPEQRDSLLREADIYVLPSYYEGLPMSILEAMSYGLPVISTPVGGIPEAVIDNKTGFLINPGDINELAKKIDVLIKDKKLRLKMGAEGRKLAIKNFDIKIIAKQVNDLYDSLEK